MSAEAANLKNLVRRVNFSNKKKKVCCSGPDLQSSSTTAQVFTILPSSRGGPFLGLQIIFGVWKDPKFSEFSGFVVVVFGCAKYVSQLFTLFNSHHIDDSI